MPTGTYIYYVLLLIIITLYFTYDERKNIEKSQNIMATIAHARVNLKMNRNDFLKSEKKNRSTVTND